MDRRTLLTWVITSPVVASGCLGASAKIEPTPYPEISTEEFIMKFDEILNKANNKTGIIIGTAENTQARDQISIQMIKGLRPKDDFDASRYFDDKDVTQLKNEVSARTVIMRKRVNNQSIGFVFSAWNEQEPKDFVGQKQMTGQERYKLISELEKYMLPVKTN